MQMSSVFEPNRGKFGATSPHQATPGAAGASKAQVPQSYQVSITVKEARGLDIERGSVERVGGESSRKALHPFVVIETPTSSVRSKVVDGDGNPQQQANPVWNETMDLSVTAQDALLLFLSCWHKPGATAASPAWIPLGSLEIDFWSVFLPTDVVPTASGSPLWMEKDWWVPLDGQATGQLHLHIRVFRPTSLAATTPVSTSAGRKVGSPKLASPSKRSTWPSPAAKAMVQGEPIVPPVAGSAASQLLDEDTVGAPPTEPPIFLLVANEIKVEQVNGAVACPPTAALEFVVDHVSQLVPLSDLLGGESASAPSLMLSSGTSLSGLIKVLYHAAVDSTAVETGILILTLDVSAVWEAPSALRSWLPLQHARTTNLQELYLDLDAYRPPSYTVGIHCLAAKLSAVPQVSTFICTPMLLFACLGYVRLSVVCLLLLLLLLCCCCCES
jgi:hypothetical protein